MIVDELLQEIDRVEAKVNRRVRRIYVTQQARREVALEAGEAVSNATAFYDAEIVEDPEPYIRMMMDKLVFIIEEDTLSATRRFRMKIDPRTYAGGAWFDFLANDDLAMHPHDSARRFRERLERGARELCRMVRAHISREALDRLPLNPFERLPMMQEGRFSERYGYARTARTARDYLYGNGTQTNATATEVMLSTQNARQRILEISNAIDRIQATPRPPNMYLLPPGWEALIPPDLVHPCPADAQVRLDPPLSYAGLDRADAAPAAASTPLSDPEGSAR